MIEPEWDDVLKFVAGLWPKHELKAERGSELWHLLRRYEAPLLRALIGDYFRENPDESWPRKLWGYVIGRAIEATNAAVTRDDGAPDAFGNTPMEIKKIVKQFRENERKRTGSMTDAEVYAAFLRANAHVMSKELRRMACGSGRYEDTPYYVWVHQRDAKHEVPKQKPKPVATQPQRLFTEDTYADFATG